jgi:hypothetical protein
VIGIILMITVTSAIPFVHSLSGIICAAALPYPVIGLSSLDVPWRREYLQASAR